MNVTTYKGKLGDIIKFVMELVLNIPPVFFQVADNVIYPWSLAFNGIYQDEGASKNRS